MVCVKGCGRAKVEQVRVRARTTRSHRSSRHQIVADSRVGTRGSVVAWALRGLGRLSTITFAMPARMIGIVAALVGLSCGSVSTQSAQARVSGTQSGFFINGDVRLSYRLDLPARTGRVPAVVFGHGSGRQSKNSCRFLADGFLSRGFATLCYDKRGVGESRRQFRVRGRERQHSGL